MEIFNNTTKVVKDDLEKTIRQGSRISIAAACFSIYAYQELKSQLEDCKELRFIFTSPTFVAEKTQKERREFYIPRLKREKSLYGTEFEVRLRNELKQKAVAKECAEFLRMFDSVWSDEDKLTDVTEEVIEMISTVYQENAPKLVYFMTIYNIFSEFLEDISEDVLPNEATGFKDSVIWNKLFNFQKDAALAIINKLEQYNGCILADSVGLGKTFTALAVIKYYEGRNKNVLVLCPKKLSENWMTYRGNLINNPLAADRLRYDILYHTDLSRDSGNTVIGLPIDRINWGNYDLVVIDESHNFRNGNGTDSRGGEKENRYMRLMNRVIKPGVKTKVLMLSATPVNNRFYDLRNQLALAYEGDPSEFNEKLNTKETFLLTMRRIYDYLYDTSQAIEQFMMDGTGDLGEMRDLSAVADDFDYDDQNTDFFSVGKKVKIDLRDMDYISWKRDIDEDIENLQLLILMVEDITPEYDFKLNELIRVIREKVAAPINEGNRKVLIFTAFSDTAEYLFDNISGMARDELGLHTALVTGSVDGKTTIPKFKADMNHVLSCFSPMSKDRDVLYPNDKTEIDILIATDCISEGYCNGG